MAKRWTDEENAIMREHYPDEGTEIIGRFKGRTKRAIWLQAMRLGLNVKEETLTKNIRMHVKDGDNGYVEWTKEEKDILRSQYVGNESRIHELIPRHTKKACSVRASVEKLTRMNTRWTDEELKLLKENIGLGIKELSPLFPGRTKAAVATKRWVLLKEMEKG